MEVSVEVDKIIKCATNYQGCQFDVHFIQCQTSADILGIMNKFVSVSRTISNMYTYPFIPQICDKNISRK